MPLTAVTHLGNGSAANGGSPSDVGHFYTLGNTEEHYHLAVLGVRGRGRAGDPHYDHDTGQGRVARRDGPYHDAIAVKNNQVVPILIETFGGFGTFLVKLLSFLSRRAKDKKRGRDGTKYSRMRPGASFWTHHSRRISSAVVMTNAANIEHECMLLKQSVVGSVAPTTPPPDTHPTRAAT